MQTLILGFLFSIFIWTVFSFIGLQGALKLFREKMLSEKWLLLVPFLFASLLFFGLRYRFLLWVMSRQTIHELFSIGSFYYVDKYVVIICLPLFYAISVLKPEWVVQTRINLPLLILLPFVIRLALFLSGVTPWEVNSAVLMPTRVE